MKHVNWIVALVAGFLIGAVVSGAMDWHWLSRPQPQQPTALAPTAPSQPAAAPRPARPPDDKTVYRVPLDGSAAHGPADALVTVVEISDFQCPYCKRVTPTLQQLEKDYAGKIRFVFKHNPLAFHPLAPGAAQAVEAARAQGGDAKFWAMHDQLFEQSPQLEQAALESAAQKLGLDLGKFKAALAAGAAKDRIAKDQTLAGQLGATGTPAFFINGRKLVGAQPIESFKAVIDEELQKAEAMVKAGTPAAGVYEAIIAKGVTAPPAAPGGEGQRPSAPATVYRKVELRKDDPVRGAADAAVTVVVFSDFQCPFCSRVEPTLKQLQDAYPGKVRFVWKHLPLGMHPNAVPAALAAEAAREQGKFWEMHDKLFADQSKLDAATYEKYARDLGLNLDRFKAAVSAKKFQDRITADQQLASTVGANGTPTMFFNCRQLVGAVPFDMMKATMDEELKKADALLKGKKAGPDFYEKACAANVALAGKEPARPQPEAQAPAAEPSVDAKALGVRSDDPTRGNPKAPVTVVLFSDFQCPFCGRVEPTLAEVEKTYGSKVKIVWKHQPLPFHSNAKPAAEAAEAAREQGKFWEMHDKLFADQQALSPAKYEQYAKDLGLNLAKFQEAQKSGRGAKRIDEDQAIAAKVGVDGTPTMFVNGERIVGAVPFEQVKAVIDRKLGGK